MPGYESWFDAKLEFGGAELQPEIKPEIKPFPPFPNILRQLIQVIQENPLAEMGVNNMANTNPFLTSILETIADDLESDIRPGLNLTPKEPFSFDPVNDDILNHEVYLDKVYGNVKQGSFVIISKDEPSNQIDESRQLFKVSHTGQIFHTKYGMGGNASLIKLGGIDGKENEQNLIFCWEEILEEIKVSEKGKEGGGGGEEEEQKEKVHEGGNELPPKETEKLIYFLNKDTHSLDPKTDRPIKNQE